MITPRGFMEFSSIPEAKLEVMKSGKKLRALDLSEVPENSREDRVDEETPKFKPQPILFPIDQAT